MLSWKEAKPEETKKSLETSATILDGIGETEWNENKLSKLLLTEAGKEKDKGKLLWPLRVALTGKKNSAGPFEVANVLGKEESLKRIKKAQTLL